MPERPTRTRRLSLEKLLSRKRIAKRTAVGAMIESFQICIFGFHLDRRGAIEWSKNNIMYVPRVCIHQKHQRHNNIERSARSLSWVVFFLGRTFMKRRNQHGKNPPALRISRIDLYTDACLCANVDNVHLSTDHCGPPPLP